MIWILREWLSQNKRPHSLNIKGCDIFSLFTWLCLSKWYIIYLWKCAVLFSPNWMRRIRPNEKSSPVFNCKWNKIILILTGFSKRARSFNVLVSTWLFAAAFCHLLPADYFSIIIITSRASWPACVPRRSCFHCLFCGRLANVHLGCTVTWLCGTGQFTLILFRARRWRVDTWPSGWRSRDATCCVLPSVWLKLTGWW